MNMFRRDFIQRLTVGGIGGAAVTGAIRANDLKTATYRVKGFTCVTCAVGLETMLQREKGITSIKASYPKATVIIRFDPELIAENSLKEFIAEMGFRVEELPGV
jgi:copper chaperone CopZ